VDILIKDKVKRIINERSKLHLNDPTVSKYWEQLVEILSFNEMETISYLEECSEEDVGWISEVFEDVAYNLNSQKYIKCLELLDNKYPNLQLTRTINIAKSYM
jgi:hypothetical protein